MKKTDEYLWLVRRRSEIQNLLFDFYVFSKDNRQKLVGRSLDRSVFGLLVGTGFSLWRAAFLAKGSRKWPEILKKAEDFLAKVIENNAINYSDDKQTSAWAVGYYLNNAKYRLEHVREKFMADSKIEKKKIKQAFQVLKNIQVPMGIDKVHSRKAWDQLYITLLASFELFRAESRFLIATLTASKIKNINNRKISQSTRLN